MKKKALRIRIYAKDGSIVLEKTGVHVDCIPASLELMPDGGHVILDIVEIGVETSDN